MWAASAKNSLTWTNLKLKANRKTTLKIGTKWSKQKYYLLLLSDVFYIALCRDFVLSCDTHPRQNSWRLVTGFHPQRSLFSYFNVRIKAKANYFAWRTCRIYISALLPWTSPSGLTRTGMWNRKRISLHQVSIPRVSPGCRLPGRLHLLWPGSKVSLPLMYQLMLRIVGIFISGTCSVFWVLCRCAGDSLLIWWALLSLLEIVISLAQFYYVRWYCNSNSE